MVDPNTENPADVKERAPEAPVVADVKKAFEEKVAEVGVRDEYVLAFQKVKDQIPENQRGALGLRVTEWWMENVSGNFAEWGAKFNDFIRNGLNSLNPAGWRDPELSDKYQKLEKSRIRAWGDLTAEKMKMDTGEWEAFKSWAPLGSGKLLDIKDRIWGPSIPTTTVDNKTKGFVRRDPITQV